MAKVERKTVGLVGRKVGMTQIFSERGELIPVTVLQAGPCTVVQKRVRAKDGYDAIQMGFEPVTKKRGPGKPAAGHFKKAGVAPQRLLREVRGMAPEEFELGQQLKADVFQLGEKVDVIGTSKGKGFQGGVRRHGFRGGADTHGSMFHRAPGSIGASSYPSRVFPGQHLPGHMGADRVTAKNLAVVGVDPDRSLLLVKGAVPGASRGVVLITAKR
ncbi:MAG TPA: 50S ribosomal protein L3 [bacterium]